MNIGTILAFVLWVRKPTPVWFSVYNVNKPRWESETNATA